MRPTVSFALAVTLAMISLAGCGGTGGGLLGLTDPVISGVVPNPVARGSSITITGTSLNGTSTTAYYANINTGGVVSTINASSGTSTSVVVSAPPNAGTYNVYVTTSDTSGDVSNPSNAVSITVN
jgi:hypothetical protein